MYSKTKKILSIFMSVLMLMTCMSQLAWADSTETVVNGEYEYDIEDKTTGKYTIAATMAWAEDGIDKMEVLDSEGNIIGGFCATVKSSEPVQAYVDGVYKPIYKQALADTYTASVTVDLDADTVDYTLKKATSNFVAGATLNGYFDWDGEGWTGEGKTVMAKTSQTLQTKYSIPVTGDIKDIAMVRFTASNPESPMTISADGVIVTNADPERKTYGTATFTTDAFDKTAQEIGLDTTYSLTSETVDGTITVATKIDSEVGDVIEVKRDNTTMTDDDPRSKGKFAGVTTTLPSSVEANDVFQVKTGFYLGATSGNDPYGASSYIRLNRETAAADVLVALYAQNGGVFALHAQGFSAQNFFKGAEANTWYDVEFNVDASVGKADVIISWDIPDSYTGTNADYIKSKTITNPSNTVWDITLTANNGRAVLKAKRLTVSNKLTGQGEKVQLWLYNHGSQTTTLNSDAKFKLPVICEDKANTASYTTAWSPETPDAIGLTGYTYYNSASKAGTITTKTLADGGDVLIIKKPGATAKQQYLGVKKTLTGYSATDKITVKTGFYKGADGASDFGRTDYIKVYGKSNGNVVTLSHQTDGTLKLQGSATRNLVMSDASAKLAENTWYDVTFVLDASKSTVDLTVTWDIPWDYLTDTQGKTPNDYKALFSVTDANNAALIADDFLTVQDNKMVMTVPTQTRTNQLKDAGDQLVVELSAEGPGGGTATWPAMIKLIQDSLTSAVTEDAAAVADYTTVNWALGSSGELKNDQTYGKVVNITNNTGAPTDAILMIAAYDNTNQTLKKVAFQKYTDLVGSMLLGYGVNAGSLETAGDYWKAFIFNNFTDLDLLVDSTTRSK